MKKRVFSGVKPSGKMHIGNYLGAIRNWVQMQHQYTNYFCVVNAHAITVPQDSAELRQRTRDVAALYIASGLDPEECVIFVQSHVPAHFELAWILNCFTPMGWLGRMTQYKEKAGDERESVSTGLFDYPVLMASDILLYHAHYVPVGNDQVQHVELTRDVAQRFNHIYGETLTLPQALIRDTGARIMSLDNPTKKMSKSDESPMGTIDMLDPPDAITRKVKRAVTDTMRDIVFDEQRPGLLNLLTIYELLSGQSRQDIEAHFAGKGYAALKAELAELLVETLRPIQERYRQIVGEPGYLDDLLAKGAERATPVANATLRAVKDRVGLE